MPYQALCSCLCYLGVGKIYTNRIYEKCTVKVTYYTKTCGLGECKNPITTDLPNKFQSSLMYSIFTQC